MLLPLKQQKQRWELWDRDSNTSYYGPSKGSRGTISWTCSENGNRVMLSSAGKFEAIGEGEHNRCSGGYHTASCDMLGYCLCQLCLQNAVGIREVVMEIMLTLGALMQTAHTFHLPSLKSEKSPIYHSIN